ncbi:MAG: DUF72 domain-containing protein, partial [Methylobacterium sp.]
VEEEPGGYSPGRLDDWAAKAGEWAVGGQPAGLPYAAPNITPPETPRETFVFFINGAKVRAPHGAIAFLDRLSSADM